MDRRLNLGGTALCHEALVSGQADVYVEYTGTALRDVLKERTRSDPREVLEIVRGGYRALGLDVGEPLGFNNTFALVMQRPRAEKAGIRTISDLRPYAATLRLGLFGEFLEREDGLPGLMADYGLRFGPPPREMETLDSVPEHDAIAVGSASSIQSVLNEQYAKNMRTLHEVCDEHNDVATARR